MGKPNYSIAAFGKQESGTVCGLSFAKTGHSPMPCRKQAEKLQKLPGVPAAALYFASMTDALFVFRQGIQQGSEERRCYGAQASRCRLRNRIVR
jgi:hypothetical protein